MVVLTTMSVMTVGMERLEELEKMPIRLLGRKQGKEAVRSFKREHIDSVICRWDLPDMPNGQFVQKLRMIRPDMPIITVVQANDSDQEISARMLGATVVADDCGRDYFNQVLASALHLPELAPTPVQFVKNA